MRRGGNSVIETTAPSPTTTPPHHPRSDMPLLTTPDAALAAFDALPQAPDGTPDRAALAAFVASHFGPPGTELEAGAPPDWRPNGASDASFLPAVPAGPIRDAAITLYGLWPLLCRRARGTGARPPSSLLPTPGWTVVPGSRFRESYYWDGYWTAAGLAASGMGETAVGVASTLASLASTVGHVPNGARTYYLHRSQPPLMADIAVAVLAAGGGGGGGGDDTPPPPHLLPTLLAAAEADYRLWTSPPRSIILVDGGGGRHSLARYCAASSTPRPEAWREDAAVAASLLVSAREAALNGIASACESGWDFSSRWLAGGVAGEAAPRDATPDDDSTTPLSSTLIRSALTHNVVPVDLNAFLARAEAALSTLAKKAGRAEYAARFAAAAAARRASIDALMWDPSAQSWRDVTLAGAVCGDDGAWRGAARSRAVTAANWAPLWTPPGVAPSLHASAAVEGLAASGLVGVSGVATTSCLRSPEQWDGRNAWPPLQALLAEGCVAAACPAGDALAERIVAGFVANAAAGIARDGVAREKYRSDTEDGTAGGGGEYDVQTGFGWTHGAVLALCARFGWPPSAERARGRGA